MLGFSDDPPVYSFTLLGVQLRRISRAALCCMLLLGIFGSWFMHGYFEEWLSKGEEFPMELLTLIQFSSVVRHRSATQPHAVVASTERALHRLSCRRRARAWRGCARERHPPGRRVQNTLELTHASTWRSWRRSGLTARCRPPPCCRHTTAVFVCTPSPHHAGMNSPPLQPPRQSPCHVGRCATQAFCTTLFD